MKTTTSKPESVIESSGNVFADLGLPNPEQELKKSELVVKLYATSKDWAFAKAEAARIIASQQHKSSLA